MAYRWWRLVSIDEAQARVHVYKLGPDSEPVLVDTGASHPEIMERLGMTGLVSPSKR